MLRPCLAVDGRSLTTGPPRRTARTASLHGRSSQSGWPEREARSHTPRTQAWIQGSHVRTALEAGPWVSPLEGTKAQSSQGQQQEPPHVTLGATGALAVVTRALWSGKEVPGLSTPVAEEGVGFDGAGGGGIFPPLPSETSPIAVLPGATCLVWGCGPLVTGVTGFSGSDWDPPASCHQGSV